MHLNLSDNLFIPKLNLKLLYSKYTNHFFL
nr:MAG TPA: hypothetical protein [Caudoviricetes sp.]